MAEVSRTARVIQNAKVALFFYCINLILQFFSRKIFLDYLGAELLGLNTTAQNLLQFLNLAESGIGAAVAFALYKPLSQGNRQEIIDIVSLQGWFYRWVGLFVITGSAVLMCFFPLIFAKAEIQLSYAYGAFIAFLISALLSYFVNYTIVVLSADQKEYKITVRTQAIKITKIFFQMLAVWKLPNGYIWWIFLEVLAAVISSICMYFCVRKEYPWLKPNISNGKNLNKQYAFVLKKTKQLFFHKIGGYVLGQTTPLVIYFFCSLTVVAIYGNYLTLIGGCLLLIDAFFRGATAGVGNLVAEGNDNLIERTFWKLVTVKLLLSGLIVTEIFLLSNSFISLWVGSEYVMDTVPLVVMLGIYFIQMNRSSEIFLSAYGLFQDVWAPLIEAILNLLLSLILGYFWGLPGILTGVLISQILVVNSWKVFFLFHWGFKKPILGYIIKYTVKVFILFGVFLWVSYISENFFQFSIQNFFEWILKAAAVLVIYTFSALCSFYFLDHHTRSVVKEVWVMLKNNFKSD